MKESNYILVENLTLITTVIHNLRSILPDEKYGISKNELEPIFKLINNLKANILNKIGNLEDDEEK